MVSSGGGGEIFFDSSDNTVVLNKTSKMAGRFRGGLKKCATFKIQAVEEANFRVFVGMVKGDAKLRLFH